MALEGWSNLNYTIMAVDEQNELPAVTQREAELKRQLDGLQSQVTGLHRSQEEVVENPELSSEVQRLKEKLDEHSKQLEQSTEKLSQLKSKNLTLRDENQVLNTASNKKLRFQNQIRPMSTLETPKSGGDATLLPMTSQGDATMSKKTRDARIYDVEDSESELGPQKEAPEGIA